MKAEMVAKKSKIVADKGTKSSKYATWGSRETAKKRESLVISMGVCSSTCKEFSFQSIAPLLRYEQNRTASTKRVRLSAEELKKLQDYDALSSQYERLFKAYEILHRWARENGAFDSDDD